MIGMQFVYGVVVVTTRSNVTVMFTQSHIASYVPNSAMLQELSHMDRITSSKMKYSRYVFSLSTKSTSTEPTLVVFSSS